MHCSSQKGKITEADVTCVFRCREHAPCYSLVEPFRRIEEIVDKAMTTTPSAATTCRTEEPDAPSTRVMRARPNPTVGTPEAFERVDPVTARATATPAPVRTASAAASARRPRPLRHRDPPAMRPLLARAPPEGGARTDRMP